MLKDLTFVHKFGMKRMNGQLAPKFVLCLDILGIYSSFLLSYKVFRFFINQDEDLN